MGHSSSALGRDSGPVPDRRLEGAPLHNGTRRSDREHSRRFYAQAANNGLLAALLGVCCLVPLSFVRHFRAFQLGSEAETGDSVFYASIFASTELLALAPAGAVLGYISASIVAIIRRKGRAKDST